MDAVTGRVVSSNAHVDAGPPLRALVVTYVFPPVGGAGVQRTAKLCKYLPEHGVTPTVLTAANPSVPLHDPSLLKDVSPDLRIVKARTLEPGYEVKKAAWKAEARSKAGDARPGVAAALVKRAMRGGVAVAKQLLIPDPQVLWQPGANLALARELRSDPPDVILISAPPFSQFLLAPLARLMGRGTAVVLDYRDEWTMYREVYEMMGKAAIQAGEAMEGWLVRRAHAITTATGAFRENLLRRFPDLDPAAIVPIPNGYDSDDFPADLPEPAGDRFRVAYAGSVLKMNCPRGFMKAVRLLHQRDPRLAAKLEVEFLGRVVDTELDAFEGMEKLGVTLRGYVPHDAVLPALSRSHAVLCTLADVPGADSMYPGKIFELMHLGRPVFTFAPRGALRDLVEQHRLGPSADPDDVEAIATILDRSLRAWEEGAWSSRSDAVDVARYHRRALAGEFARTFREAVARARA
jgi:glycosyltransferase involved in cell wall biosynthesis